MTFTEIPFVWLLLSTYTLWTLARGRERLRLTVLLTASAIFYGYRQPSLLVLLGAYCLVDWGIGLWLPRTRWPRLILGLGVGFNLTGLCYWKYTPLFLYTSAWLASTLHLPVSVPLADSWSIPFGISFFTFTGIAYMVDVYRNTALPERSLARFTLYKTFFPQLVAGPILRPNEFLIDLQPGRLPDHTGVPLEAGLLLTLGLFKKMVLADRIALAVDPFFAHVGDPSTAGIWSLPYIWLYAFQIYFDFSGYTDMARGLGLFFGFRWPDNFDMPYLATSVQDFWRRWHLTLSRFLRDYLYIPLGGNRGGPLRTLGNLMATMLLGGLWHGASWTFMLWGGLHGLFLMAGRLWSETQLQGYLSRLTGLKRKIWRLVCVVLTFHVVCLAWVFFRLSHLDEALVCLRQWAVFDRAYAGGSADLSLWLLLGAYGVALLAVRRLGGLALLVRFQRYPNIGSLAHGFAWGLGLALLLLAVVLSPGGEKPPFIYFQF